MRRRRGKHTLSLWQWGLLVLMDAGATLEWQEDRSLKMTFARMAYWVNPLTFFSLRRKRLVSDADMGLTSFGRAAVDLLSVQEVTCFVRVWPMHDVRHYSGKPKHLGDRYRGRR